MILLEVSEKQIEEWGTDAEAIRAMLQDIANQAAAEVMNEWVEKEINGTND